MFFKTYPKLVISVKFQLTMSYVTYMAEMCLCGGESVFMGPREMFMWRERGEIESYYYYYYYYY